MAVKEKTEGNEETLEAVEVEWSTVDNELHLLQILCGTRPIGIRREKTCENKTSFSPLVSQLIELKSNILNNYIFTGISKYFQMACIVEKLAMNLNKEVTSKGVWDHLASLYDLKKLVCELKSKVYRILVYQRILNVFLGWTRDNSIP